MVGISQLKLSATKPGLGSVGKTGIAGSEENGVGGGGEQGKVGSSLLLPLLL